MNIEGLKCNGGLR